MEPLRNQRSSNFGFLYVVTNQAMPGLVKIGQTERHPMARLVELSDHSGVPIPFDLVCSYEVSDRFAAEAAVHEALSQHRIGPDREFFRVTVQAAEAAILDAAREYLCDYIRARPKREPERRIIISS